LSMRGLGRRVALRPTPQSWEVPPMQQFPTRVKVGLDVHAAQTHVAVLDPAGGEVWTRRVQGPPEVALELLSSLGPGATAVYEAGPTGFGLARVAAERGLDRRVVSPGQLHFEDRAATATFVDYLVAVDALVQRRSALERTLSELVPESPFAREIARFRCFRGIDTLSASGIAAEVGDFARFAHPRLLAG